MIVKPTTIREPLVLGGLLPRNLPLLSPPLLLPAPQNPTTAPESLPVLDSSVLCLPDSQTPQLAPSTQTSLTAPEQEPTHDGSCSSLPESQPPLLPLAHQAPITEPEPSAPALESEFQPIPGVVFGPDGRFRRVVQLNRHERRFLRKFEPELDTLDLKMAKELILWHLHQDRLFTFNVAFTLLQIRDRCLFSQDGYLDFPTWLKIEAKGIGISIGYAYRLLNMADALDRYLITTFMSTWHMSIEDVAQRATQLSYFMTGIYRHLTLDDLKEPFLKAKPEQFISLVTGRKIPTREEVEAARAARHQQGKGKPPVVTATDIENKIVETVRLGLDVYIVGLNDINDAPYIEKALLANRRKEADAIFSARAPEFINKGGECKDFLTIRTLEDAKYLLLYHQAEGIPHRLVCAVICARLEADPVLSAQWKALGYEKVHEYLLKELQVTFDTYRYCQIGRNYLKREAIILNHTAIDTEVQFSKLYNLEQAIETHGDEALIWRYFGPEATVGEWDYFALHKKYQQHFSEKKMSPAKLKKARTLLFEYHEARAADDRTDGQLGPLAGTTPYPFSIAATHEKRLIDLFREKPDYLLKYVNLYFEYKDKGLL
jgi:hypothetical protein